MNLKKLTIIRAIGIVFNSFFALSSFPLILLSATNFSSLSSDDKNLMVRILSFFTILFFASVTSLLLYISHIVKERKYSKQSSISYEIIDIPDFENNLEIQKNWKRKFEPLVFWSVLGGVGFFISGGILLYLIFSRPNGLSDDYWIFSIFMALVLNGVINFIYIIYYKSNINTVR